MISSTHREALSILTEICSLTPEIRLGQLWGHLGFLGEGMMGKSLAYLEDDQMIQVLKRHRDQLAKRMAEVA